MDAQAIDWIPVGTTGDFAPGSITEVLLAGGVVAIAHTDTGFHAFDNNCRHMGVALSRGRLEGDTVVCPMHNWAYDLRTSRITCPARAGVFATFPTRVEGDTLMVLPVVRPPSD